VSWSCFGLGLEKNVDHNPCAVCNFSAHSLQVQESRAVERKPRDAVAVRFGLKFADDIYYKFKSSQASKPNIPAQNRI